MKSGRFFVTLIAILSLAVACVPSKKREQAGAKAMEQRKALEAEGNQSVKDYKDIEADLQKTYNLHIADSGKEAADSKFDFNTVSLAQRKEIAGKIAQLLQKINRVIEISSRPLMQLDNVGSLVAARESAEAYQKSIEDFEKKNGENFDPKPAAAKQVKND